MSIFGTRISSMGAFPSESTTPLLTPSKPSTLLTEAAGVSYSYLDCWTSSQVLEIYAYQLKIRMDITF
jgi:hypothetical protein